AGSRSVVELHGSLAAVHCIACDVIVTRDDFQSRLLDLNAGWSPLARASDVAAAPDGDAELDDAAIADFVVPECAECAGIMKPHVVFFGENVPARVVGHA